jgi:hypothetical protein
VVARRSEIYWVSLDPTVGTEIQKTRPCVVVSPDELNARLRSGDRRALYEHDPPISLSGYNDRRRATGIRCARSIADGRCRAPPQAHRKSRCTHDGRYPQYASGDVRSVILTTSLATRSRERKQSERRTATASATNVSSRRGRKTTLADDIDLPAKDIAQTQLDTHEIEEANRAP